MSKQCGAARAGIVGAIPLALAIAAGGVANAGPSQPGVIPDTGSQAGVGKTSTNESWQYVGGVNPGGSAYQNVPTRSYEEYQQGYTQPKYESVVYETPGEAEGSVAEVVQERPYDPNQGIAPVQAPEGTVRFGALMGPRPEFLSQDDADRINNTSAVLEAQGAEFFNSLGFDTTRSQRMIASGMAGAAVGALAVGAPTALVGAGIGGLAGYGIGQTLGFASLEVAGVGLVLGPVVGAFNGVLIGAGTGAVIGGAIGAPIGAIIGTAYGSGENMGEAPEQDPRVNGATPLGALPVTEAGPGVGVDSVSSTLPAPVPPAPGLPSGITTFAIPSHTDAITAATHGLVDAIAQTPNGQAADDALAGAWDASQQIARDVQAGIDAAAAPVRNAVAAQPHGDAVLAAVDQALAPAGQHAAGDAAAVDAGLAR
jgi:hypothetical protein